MVVLRRAFVQLSICGGAFIAAGARALAEPTGPERAAMEQLAAEYMRSYEVPGLSIAIFRAGQPVYTVAFGFADKEAQEPLTPKHLFRIASVTKPITSTAIFLLIERGGLSLGSLVFGANSVLGAEFPMPRNAPYLDQITIEHLLTHTAGGWENNSLDPMFRNPEMDHSALITWTLQNLRLEHPPGTRYAYSNFGYCLLGRVIEKVARQPYDRFVKEEILRKLGLTGMRIAGNTLAERAPGEVKYYGQGRDLPYAINVSRMDSHGGWIATPTDLASFATHIDGFPDTMQLLRHETLIQMTTPSAANHGYAKGLRVNSGNNWWHTGSLPGTATIMVRTHTNLCWAAFANTRSPRSRMAADMNRLIWKMVRTVPGWRA
jgi:CubicO group peptidase (beta-lactamase class C family)